VILIETVNGIYELIDVYQFKKKFQIEENIILEKEI